MLRKMNEGFMQALLTILGKEVDRFYVVGYIDNDQTAVVEVKNTCFHIWDNGGELGIEEINKRLYDTDYFPDMIPLTWFGAGLDPLTMAYRVKQVFKGEAIDYKHSEAADIVETYCEWAGVPSQRYKW